MMSELFDHSARIMRAARVKTTLSRADFLLDRVGEGLADRLDDVKRDFPNAAVLGGAGVVAAALRGRAGTNRLIQIEDCQAMADFASQIVPEADIRVSPSEEPDLSPGQLDLIVGALTMHRLNDPVGLLTQMRLALKPDGLALITLFGGQTLSELRASFAEAETEVEGGISPRVAPMGEVRDLGGLLQRAGFALPVADVDRFDVAYQTPFHLMRDLREMGENNTLIHRRKSFTRRATMIRMAEIYAANYPAADHTGEGRVNASFEIVYLTGWSPDVSQQQPLRPGSAKSRLSDALRVPETSAGEKAGE